MRTPSANPRLENSSPDTRRESTERRILESAVELIATGVAWHQLGIRQIAERADISRTAFYDFFGSKNEVLEQLVSGLHEDLAQVLIEPVDGNDPALDLAHLRVLLGRIADYNAVHGPVYRAFLDATGDDPRLDGLWDDLTRIYVELLVGAIERTRDAHVDVPRSPDSDSLARVLLVMTERTMLLLLRDAGDASRRADLLEALAQVWERAVFGGPLP